jgi:hypothetical protein
VTRDSHTEERAWPRFEVYAVVRARHGDDLLILSVKNISLGGVFVVADAAARVHFPLGTEHDLTLLAAHEESESSIALGAMTLRHEDDGVAFMITRKDERLAEMIAQLKQK